mgnify:CR=1
MAKKDPLSFLDEMLGPLIQPPKSYKKWKSKGEFFAAAEKLSCKNGTESLDNQIKHSRKKPK